VIECSKCQFKIIIIPYIKQEEQSSS